MKISWSQPSLSRDFALLSAAILFVLVIISAWVTFSTYNHHTELVTAELDKESRRIEMALTMQMDAANYMLTSLGKQIVLDPDRNLTKLAQVLKSFDKKDYIYSILSWVNPQEQMVVSSNRGVLEKPVDISDRDYIKTAFTDPWKMNIGRPIEGRVSGRWIIPVSMGITDYTGKFIGTVTISMDIGVLTDQLANVIRRDGISFAIVSKTLIPITQISDDKDFVNNNFPIQKLMNFNFSKNPSGLISQGSMLWDSSNYSYYRATSDMPYIVLLAYDPRFSDETVRSYLWSRLMQMVAMAIFFVLFLWITRMRMIRPIMEMTNIAANVAKGSPCDNLPKGGPVEIEGLSAQIRKVSEYIAENKRIEHELRNKIHLFVKAKEQAEMERRSQSEFMAYVSQEMRNPLNNIVGWAQILKDQLHGPLENRKYRQYANDIFSVGNSIINQTQDLTALAKADTGYFEITERPADVAGAINRAVRFMSDKMQAERLSIKIQMQDPMPRLIGDEFRLQQILMNVLLHASNHALPDGTITLEALHLSRSREHNYFAFVISSSGHPPYTREKLLEMAEEMFDSSTQWHPHVSAVFSKEKPDIGLELAKTLVALHHGVMDITNSPDNSVAVVIFFPGNRVRFTDGSER